NLDLDLVPRRAQGFRGLVDAVAVRDLVTAVTQPDHPDGREEPEAAVPPLADDVVHAVTLAGAVHEGAVLVVVFDGDQCASSGVGWTGGVGRRWVAAAPG